MTTASSPNHLTLPMTIGSPIGPDLGVTVSADVETTLANSEVTFAGVAPEGGAARGVHWLTQMSSRKTLVASQNHPSGAMLSTVYLIERTDDQGRTWACVTTTAWTAGLFLSRAEAL